MHPPLPGRKKNIEWSQESWNWMSGCDGVDGVHCVGCYAKKIAETRLRGRHGYPQDDPFRVVLHPDKLFGHAPETLPAWAKQQISRIGNPYTRWSPHPLVKRRPTVYFNVSMGDWMFAESNWRLEALKIMEGCPQHIFVTLTKQYDKLWMIAADSPEISRMGWTPHAIESVRAELSRVGSFTHIPSKEIPRNVIVGISVTKKDQVHGIDELRKVPAFIRMVCFEPLLEDVSDMVDLTGIGWIIIGKRTRQKEIPEFTPEKEWVDALIAKARRLDIPVFLKPSMTAPAGWESIQETAYDYIKTTMLAEEEG